MGFEQLAALRDQLAAEAKQKKAAKRPARNENADPVIQAIQRLQRQFPKAFPKRPAPKVPLKVGISEDAKAAISQLRLTEEELKTAIATWCNGVRYWQSMVEDAERLDLQGNPAGRVSAGEAARAKRQLGQELARKRRERMTEQRANSPTPANDTP